MEKNNASFVNGHDIVYLMMIPERSYRTTIFALSLVLLFHLIEASACAEEKMFRARIDHDGVQRVEITGGEYYYEQRSHSIS